VRTDANSPARRFISLGPNKRCSPKNVCQPCAGPAAGRRAGPKGIKPVLVPKFHPDADGNPATQKQPARRQLCEHKLLACTEPTAVMEYDGATGWMSGRGKTAHWRRMFTMMNNATPWCRHPRDWRRLKVHISTRFYYAKTASKARRTGSGSSSNMPTCAVLARRLEVRHLCRPRHRL